MTVTSLGIFQIPLPCNLYFLSQFPYDSTSTDILLPTPLFMHLVVLLFAAHLFALVQLPRSSRVSPVHCLPPPLPTLIPPTTIAQTSPAAPCHPSPANPLLVMPHPRLAVPRPPPSQPQQRMWQHLLLLDVGRVVHPDRPLGVAWGKSKGGYRPVMMTMMTTRLGQPPIESHWLSQNKVLCYICPSLFSFLPISHVHVYDSF